MKKLLSMLAVSTLVGTSASSLKPLFTSNVNQSFKSNQSNKNVNIHGENDNNPFVSKIISKNEVINSSTIAPNGDIYVLSSTGSQGDTTSKLYKSKDGFDFTEIKVFDIFIETLVIAPNGDIYGGTLTKGLWKSPDGGSTFNQVVSDKFDRFAMAMRLYEYLRSYLYMNAKTKKTPIYKHEWDFEKLAKILNLGLNSSYFKNISMLKIKILEPVKRDLLKTDIIFTYELIKVGRKYSKIILNTHLDLEKFNAQNPELEKVPIKKEYKVYADKSKLTTNNFKKSKIIDQPILTDEEVKKIMHDFDNH